MREKQLCRHQGQWGRRGRRCSRHWSRDSLAARGEDHGEAGFPPCSPLRSMMEQISMCSLWKTPHRSRWVHPKEAVTLWRASTGAGSWLDLRPHGDRGPHTRTHLLAGLVTSWSIHAGALCCWWTAPYGKDPRWSNLWRTAAYGKD